MYKFIKALVFLLSMAGQSNAQEWTNITYWDEEDDSYYVEIDDIASSPLWRFELPLDAYSLDIKAGKFNNTWRTTYRRMEISLGPNTLWYEDCPDGSTCPEWEVHNMRPDLYPSAKDSPVFTDTDKTILAKKGIYYFKFSGGGKAGLRIVFRDINGTVIKAGKPTVCGGPSRTPIPSPTPSEANCNKGLLPPLNLDGFPGWLGLRRVGISPTEVHTWCVNLNWDTRLFTMSVVDRTGAAQCFYHLAEFIPPEGSGIPKKGNRGLLINTNATFFSDSGYLPKGIWKIKIDPANEYTSCPMSYEVTAR